MIHRVLIAGLAILFVGSCGGGGGGDFFSTSPVAGLVPVAAQHRALHNRLRLRVVMMPAAARHLCRRLWNKII